MSRGWRRAKRRGWSWAAAIALATALPAIGCTAILDITNLVPAEGGADGAPPGDSGRDAGRGDANDASADRSAPVDATDAAVAAPRPIAPLSTSRVTSRKPTLSWALPNGVTSATVDLCSDRACKMPIGTPTHVTGTSYAPTVALPVGVVFWRLHPSTSTTVTSPTWEFTVGARSAAVDTSWGTTLDVNGDGYADVVVGAPNRSTDAGMNSGSVSLYLGGSSGLSTVPTTTLVGSSGASGNFGWHAASAGDVNGDGYADLVVGAPASMGYAGSVYIYLGGPSGLAATPAATLYGPDGANGFFGISVASAGDLDGDGYADIVVGAEGASSNTGKVYTYRGSATGIADKASPTGFLDGPATSASFGISVAGAGDVNGDGYGDIVVGAYGVAMYAGRAYVFLGSKTGIVAKASSILISPGGPNGQFGLSVAGAGDVNGDGYADIVVGASLVPPSDTGNAYVYLGSATGLNYEDGGAAPPATTLVGPNGLDGYFGFSVAGAGDVNGDGYADLVVGSPSDGFSSPGACNVYLGGTKGIDGSTSILLANPVSPIQNFGWAVASAGDVTGNGYDAIVIGAPQVTSGDAGANAGNAYFYYGGSSGPSPFSPAALNGPGGKNGQFGWTVFGAAH
jgi:FG-GAP repeat protein/VCBS repeat protein